MTRDRWTRYAGCDAPFREGPTSMRCRAVRHEPNLPDAAREWQDNLERDDETLFCRVLDDAVMCRIAERAEASARVLGDGSRDVGERRRRRLHRDRRQ